MSLYAVDIDLDNQNTSHAQVVNLVGRNKNVLDVGCWNGDLGRVLMTQGCRVTGVEVDPGAAEAAREFLEHVVVADLDRTPLSTSFPDARFDVIVFADVLEHVMDPAGVLADAAALLTDDGYVVISIPNITHGSVRLALLQGRWSYTDTGLLDRTHIKFFSRSGLVDLVHSAGFAVDELIGTVADPLTVEVDVAADALSPSIVEWVRDQPDSLIYQFVLSVRPSGDAGSTVVPPLVPAAPESDVRLRDHHTERAREEREARHHVLTVRDHIIGLEAAAATAATRADRAEATRRELRDRLRKKNDELARLRKRIRALKRQAAATPPPAVEGPSVWVRVKRRLRR